MRAIIVNFVERTTNEMIMNTLEKRDFIDSHLHRVDDSLIDEFFTKMLSFLNKRALNLAKS
jgi:hypothetical protein